MRIFETIFVATALLSPVYIGAAQATAAPTTANTSFTPSPPSTILQHSLDEVQRTTGEVRLDKWKRGTVRDEATSNIDAIQRDLQGTLRALLKDADSNPGSLSKALPLSRNVDALYDVLVHVVEAARVSGTSEQVGQLQQSMADLEKARLALDNQMQQLADVQERQIVELHSTVQKQDASLRAAATTPAPKCPAPTPAKRKKPSASTTNTKPAAAVPANQQPKTQ